MKKYDVIIIGGGPAGIITAGTAKTYYRDKSILVIRKEEKSIVPCGIPYMMSTIGIDQNFIPDKAITGNGSELLVDEVMEINIDKKTVKTSKETFECDKMVLAMGSSPTEPAWLKGREKKNVFYIKKSSDYLAELREKSADFKKIVILGGGFIGVEVADELNKNGLNITIVEKLPHMLSLALDSDLCTNVDETLKERGLNVVTNATVKEIIGGDKVEGVLLEDGSKLEADAVIVSIGYTPNTEIAKNAGLLMGPNKTIWVDEYMRTNKKDIFAVGDCVERKSFITRKISHVMLASTATSEARIAGANLFKLQILKTFTGTIGIFSTRIGERAFACAGLTERMAKEEGFDITIGIFETKDRHPGSMPDASTIQVKLIASKKSGTLIGGQVCGAESAGELINIIGLMIQKKMSVHDIMILQIGTHPLLTAAPTVYPIIKAAEQIIPNL